MTTPHEGSVAEDHPTTASDDALAANTTDQVAAGDVPEWAPGAPLPSSETLLAAFAGVQSLHSTLIIDAAVDLVASQRQFRQALERLTEWPIDDHRLKRASWQLVSAREDSEVLIAAIDDAVDHRHRLRAASPSPLPPVEIDGIPAGTPVMVVQTETIGALVARMADLWGLVLTAVETDEEPPEATQLAQLCRGYDCLILAIEIESGQQLIPEW